MIPNSIEWYDSGRNYETPSELKALYKPVEARIGNYLTERDALDTFTHTSTTVDQSNITGIYEHPWISELPAINAILGNTFEMLFGENYGQIGSKNDAAYQFKAATDELKTRVANGETVSMYDLEQKITFGGFEFSMGTLVDIQKMTKTLVDISEDPFSKEGGNFLAKVEASRAALQVYSDSLGSELGEGYSATINKALDIKVRNYQSNLNVAYNNMLWYEYQNSNMPSSHRHSWHDDELAEMQNKRAAFETWSTRNSDAADLFKNIDTSSKDALSKSLEKQMAELKKMQEKYQSDYMDIQQQSLQNYIDKLLKQFSHSNVQSTNNQANTVYSPYSYEIRDLNQKA